MCDGRIAALQGADEEPMVYCPHCGLGIRRIVSRASFKVAANTSPEAAAKRGFTTYRKAGSGVYEKAAGEGEDVLAKDDAG